MKEGQARTSVENREETGREGERRSAEDMVVKDVEEESLFVDPTASVQEEAMLGADDVEDDDELDALLMDEPILQASVPTEVEDRDRPEVEGAKEGFEDRFAEEMRMMEEMEDW